MTNAAHFTPEVSERIAQWAASSEPTIRPDAKANPGTEHTRAETRAMLIEAATNDPEGRQLLELLLN